MLKIVVKDSLFQNQTTLHNIFVFWDGHCVRQGNHGDIHFRHDLPGRCDRLQIGSIIAWLAYIQYVIGKKVPGPDVTVAPGSTNSIIQKWYAPMGQHQQTNDKPCQAKWKQAKKFWHASLFVRTSGLSCTNTTSGLYLIVKTLVMCQKLITSYNINY